MKMDLDICKNYQTISSVRVDTDRSKTLCPGVMSHNQDIVKMHDIIYKSGEHNFKKSRIPLKKLKYTLSEKHFSGL